MKYSNAIILFLLIFILISCNKKTDVSEIPAKDTSIVTNTDKPKNIPPQENSNKSSQENKPSFKTYCNARYDFCIQYPDILIKQEESIKDDEAKWDGVKFVSKDGRIRMSAWGWDNVNIDMQYQTQLEGLDVTYNVKKKSFFVVTGWKKDGTGYYTKTKIIRDNNDNIDHVIAFEFTFPREEKPKCAPLIEYIENHF
ncbi:MAG: hypothetical protein K1X86_16085 [Ignavibacteria bacterium]|nr:hypothetical protein [Ignavibacteria bacterium]